MCDRHVCSYGIELSLGHLENAIILIDQSKGGLFNQEHEAFVNKLFLVLSTTVADLNL